MDGKLSYIREEIRKLVSILEKTVHIETIILFGSHAKGTASDESDIDIAVISPTFGHNPLFDKQLVYRTVILEDIDPLFDVHTFPRKPYKPAITFLLTKYCPLALRYGRSETISTILIFFASCKLWMS